MTARSDSWGYLRSRLGYLGLDCYIPATEMLATTNVLIFVVLGDLALVRSDQLLLAAIGVLTSIDRPPPRRNHPRKAPMAVVTAAANDLPTAR